MKTKQIFLLILAVFSITSISYSQIGDLKKLGKKLEDKTEKAVEKAVDKNIKNAEKEVSPSSTSNASKNTSKDDASDVKPDFEGKVIHVSKQHGSNKNDGSKETPLKNLDKAIQIAQPGTAILVTGGIETGTLDAGFIECDKAVKIFGSWDESFSKQDIKTHPTVIQPTNESARSNRKAIMKFTKNVDGVVLDNLVFDEGQRNAYHAKEGIVKGVEGGRLLPPTEKPAVGFPTVGEPMLQFVSATAGGDVTIQNCVFVNASNFALQAGHRSGKFTVKNNIFIANKMAAIEIFGTCANPPGPGNMSKCGEVEIAYNTILFTWSRTKDFQDMGYGVRIMTKAGYDIHHNIIGASILAGVDHTRFNKNEWIKVDNNIFFVNKDKDFHYSPASNTRLRIDAKDMEEVDIASASGNKNEIPPSLKVNKDYLEGYLNARYSETTDFDRNSPSNQWRSAMGMNMQGSMSSSVTMFGNKYPWKEAIELFGNVKGYGAQ